MKVKKPAQTGKGYQFQSLYAAKLMIDSLTNKNKYEKFALEADRSIAEEAIDDIVCYNKDKVDYYQVKHTDNIVEHSLDFEWLFDKERNILEKMFKGYKKQIERNKISNIFLITTREPDILLGSCLNEDGYLIYNEINDENLNIINELFKENLDSFKNFLQVLIFKTIEDYDLLEDKIKNQIDEYYDNNNFDKYIRTIEKWSTNEHIPNIDGFIYKNNIQKLISCNKNSLEQTFDIEPDYVELNNFNKYFEKEIKKNKVTVLYGEAGTGKSSFLTNFLKDKKNHIRHYYFLSVLQPNNIERINFKNVKESLEHQLRDIDKKNFNGLNLKEMLEIQDLNSNIKSNPFYIVIDGIDHVYRNNKKNIEPLNQLINLIFSLNLINTKIIISTQMSDHDIYPPRLLNEFPKNEWIEINKLNKKELLEYIKNQNFTMTNDLDIEEISNILYQKTQGHPLLLYYIKEYLKKMGKLNKELLYNIKTCSTINEYYDYILSNMDRYEKFTLFAMSQYNFIWYKYYLKDIINRTFKKDIIENKEDLELNNIHFLFKKLFNNGLMFHHESLIRYVKEKKIIPKPKEKHYIIELNKWIINSSPEHIKNIWGNYLIIKDNHFPEGIDSSWIAQRISEGYSRHYLKELLIKCRKLAKKNTSHIKMHYFNDLLYRLQNDYNIFAEDDALIEIYSTCSEDIFFESLNYMDDNSLKFIYILTYIAKNRDDDELLQYAKNKFSDYINNLDDDYFEYSSDYFDIEDFDEYSPFLFIMIDEYNIDKVKKKLPNATYSKDQMSIQNRVVLDFRTVNDIKNIYRTSSKDNKKQLSLFLAFHHLKNKNKIKFLSYLFNPIKKEVCLKTNTITINDFEDDKYYNLYFSYFLKYFYLKLKKGLDIDVQIIDSGFNSINFLNNDFKNAIEYIADSILKRKKIDFIGVFNDVTVQIDDTETYFYLKNKKFNEFKILLLSLCSFYNKPSSFIDFDIIKYLIDNNIDKFSILKVGEFLKSKIFCEKSILKIKKKIEEELSLKIITNDIEGSENEYLFLFRYLKFYNILDNNILFNFCKVSLSYGYNKDESLYFIIYSVYFVYLLDKKNAFKLLDEIVTIIYYLDQYTNLKELRPIIKMFNFMLDDLKKDKSNVISAPLKKYLNSNLYFEYKSENIFNCHNIYRPTLPSNIEYYLKSKYTWIPTIHGYDEFYDIIHWFFNRIKIHNKDDVEKHIESAIRREQIFPYHKLVYIYLKNGQEKKALNFIKSLIETIKEETTSLIPSEINLIPEESYRINLDDKRRKIIKNMLNKK